MTAVDYRSAGKRAYRMYGVHHLSKSSVDSLMDCSEKFILRSKYHTAKPNLLLGQALHSISELISVRLAPFTQKILEGSMSEAEVNSAYPAMLRSVFDDIVLADTIMQSVHDELDKLFDSSKEIIYSGGLSKLEKETLQAAETLAKSVEVEHFLKLHAYPVLYPELNVKYLHPGLEIPYEGFVDQIILKDGRMHVSDLKTTYSINDFVWDSVFTIFQLWLYAKSFVQMGYTDILPEGHIGRLIIDTKPKSKIRPSKFEVKVEFRRITDLSRYDSTCDRLLKGAERMIKYGIELHSNPKFGCKGCDYYSMCSKKFTKDAWEAIDEKTD